MVVLVNNQRRKHPVPVHQFRRNHPGRSTTFLRVLAQRHFLSQTTLCHHKEAQRIVHRVLLFTIKIHSAHHLCPTAQSHCGYALTPTPLSPHSLIPEPPRFTFSHFRTSLPL